MKHSLLTIAVCALLFASCKKDVAKEDLFDGKALPGAEKEGLFKGPQTQVFDGKAHSWLKTNGDRSPQQFGITIDAAAFSSLPDGLEAEEHDFQLALHPKAKEVTPFNFVLMEWNPHGHEPAGIYDLPHFDFHFYMVPELEVDAATDNTKLNSNVSADYLPEHYVAGPPVPKMGKHWVDVTSPEFNGGTFTQTFIFGSYDSKITFYEPMITRAFLNNTTHFERAIPQPAKVQKTGYYPTRLLVIKQDGSISVILDSFVYRQAS